METQLSQYQSLVQRADQLRLQAFSIAEGLQSGSFHSLFKGHGIEFTGVREYLRGDDVRVIDWNVTARMSKPFVKMFEEDRELVVFLVLDRSLSMNTGFNSQSRLECANEIAELTMLRNDYVHETGQMQKKIDELPTEIEQTKARLERIKKDKQNSADLKEFSSSSSSASAFITP